MSKTQDQTTTLTQSGVAPERRRGRGACSNQTGRFETETRESFDDGWQSLADLDAFKTNVHDEYARTIITNNKSPDLSFDQSINPYRGCEHGCVYCYARPTHCFLGHSAGLDFETELYAKPNAADLLQNELADPRYKVKTIALGTNTDPYQPIEREQKITRSILEVCAKTNHPIGIVTKSALVTRDIDILAPMAAKGLAKVALSITTLDRHLARAMEPRASTPSKRLNALRELSDVGIPTAVMIAPVIPGLNDHEIEQILQTAKDNGVKEAGYILLRLPLEIKGLFREWLAANVPNRATRIINILRTMHGGSDYVPEFGHRQRGSGPYAEQIAARIRLMKRKLSLKDPTIPLRTDLFSPPPQKPKPGDQLALI